MLRMTRQADYAIVLLTYFAHHPTVAIYNARDLAGHVHLPEPMVGKILKLLARAGMLTSTRGVKGGYHLASDPASISVADIVQAVEGPISITECTSTEAVNCSIAAMCAVKSNWQTINRVVHDALSQISLAQMTGPLTLGSRATVASTHGPLPQLESSSLSSSAAR